MRNLALALVLFLTACHDSESYSPTSPDVMNALTITASQTSLPADGFSTITVTATIDPGADAANKILEFYSTSCTFIEGTASPLERTVDSSGKTEVHVKSTQTPGPAEVRVRVKAKPEVSRTLALTITPADPDQTIRLSAARQTAPADGASTTPVYADLNTSIPPASRQVTFNTTKGTFAQDAGKSTVIVSADPAGRATADLVSPTTPGSARVSATAFNVSRDLTMEFTRALPETIVVQPDKEKVKATSDDAGKVTLTIAMRRAVGKVSEGTMPAIRVVSASTGSTLPFIVRNLTPSSPSGESSAILIAGPLSFRGIATIEVTVDGATTVGTANIEVVD